jgi:hypothetical protein
LKAPIESVVDVIDHDLPAGALMACLDEQDVDLHQVSAYRESHR